MKHTKLILGVFAALAGAVILTSGTKASAQSAPGMIQIKPGDTLAKIAQAHGTTYMRLFNANPAIADPNKIYAGQSIRIPAPHEQLPERMAKPASTRKAAVAPSKPKVAAAKPAPAPAGVWDKLAQCESGGRWNINTGNGYYGGLQFSMGTWTGHGGTGSPAHASREQQIAIAERVLKTQGWGAWPACARKLGLR